jgi:hypothetical protein
MTRERILEILKKICKEHLKYTRLFVIGFVMADDDKVFLAKKERQNGKEILLMKAGCSLHEYFKTIEKEEDIAFERVSEETRKKMWYFIFTDEEGNKLERPFEFQPYIEERIEPKPINIVNTYNIIV